VTKPQLISTNRIILKVTPLSTLRDIKVACFPETSAQTYEEVSSTSGYYLIDAVRGPGPVKQLQERVVEQTAPSIFRQELSEMGIPVEKWPDVNDYEKFKQCFLVEQLALIADLGEEPIENIVIEL
jgi:hypothetical protein